MMQPQRKDTETSRREQQKRRDFRKVFHLIHGRVPTETEYGQPIDPEAIARFNMEAAGQNEDDVYLEELTIADARAKRIPRRLGKIAGR